LSPFLRDPEDNDVVVPLPGVRVEGVGTRVAEEDERFTAHLVNRLALGPGVHAHVGHAKREVVHVFDASWPGILPRHTSG
jgi:hypothetical protein